ncbi:hypothetical protein B0T11DRAFT_270637 [Plectosphaerella cucumerina]|uniref:GATA-type domain-containing protein n=1 Tax=Plectosphaerella cucumerina TaxID=40658 RepID=A0A8K0TNN9_9PEZI|nr:hypothetical protein B0T11DRAFT_270637 [Plectosphaerella cucumerina]
MMATPANHTRDPTQPVCQNCSTSTTPLWRRDEYGAVLCNACGLFLKLHGRPRPISLKTDVIKSRNRVKTMRPDLATKKKQQQQAQQAAAQQQAQGNFGASDPNGFDLNAQLGSVTPAQRQKANGHGDNNSPGSRGGTPSLYNPAMTGFHTLDDSHFQSGALTGFSPNRPGSPLNGDRNLDTPQTHEQLIAANSALKTRVSELEVINELFRGRLGQLEHDEATARRGQEISGQAEAQLRAQLEDSHRRENNMKRRLDELEIELKAVRDAANFIETDRPYKRARLSEQPEDRDAEQVAFAVEQAADQDAEMVSAADGAVAAAVAAAAVSAAEVHEAQVAQEAQEARELQDLQDAPDTQEPQEATEDTTTVHTKMEAPEDPHAEEASDAQTVAEDANSRAAAA